MRRDFDRRHLDRRDDERRFPEPSRVGIYFRRRLLIAGLVFLITFVIFPAIMLGIYLVLTWVRSMNRLDAAGVAKVVADLHSNNPALKQAAVKRLLNATPDPGQRDIAEALKPLLHEGGFLDRHNVVKALGRWGNSEDAAAVATLLQEKEHGLRWPAIQTLGQLKGKVAAETLVKHLANIQDRGQISDALKHMPVDAEPALIACLAHGDAVIREVSCEVLSSLGTSQSVAALEKACNDPEPQVAKGAQNALQAVRQRLK